MVEKDDDFQIQMEEFTLPAIVKQTRMNSFDGIGIENTIGKKPSSSDEYEL